MHWYDVALPDWYNGTKGAPAMNTTDTTIGIPDEIKAELQETLDTIAKGIRDPEKARQALDRMNRIREENRKLFGEQNIAVELIRQTRDQA
jgi:hypothetical protein